MLREPQIFGFDDAESIAERVGKLLQDRGAGVASNEEPIFETNKAAPSQRVSEAISEIAAILRAGNDFDREALAASLDELALLVSTF